MPGTFSQIYIQLVFAVKGRESLIQPEWEERLYRYVSAIIRNKEQKLLAINGMPDHIHVVLGMKPSCCLSDLVREIKKSSNSFIKDEQLSKYRFSWQEGFGAFSYGHRQLVEVIKYVINQKQHHRKNTFREEYIGFLKDYEIEHEERFLFEWTECH